MPNDVALRHQIKIATRTLHLNDAGAVVLGGMSKQEAYDLLRDNGYSHDKLVRMQGGSCSQMIIPREDR
ncbi:MAG: hypothetical protein CMQ40_05085 [Gammaproteobacteria bacterium]|nr:hypothetical protein [Gammaproteobacteria bacterium]